jgi:hypothetical protein
MKINIQPRYKHCIKTENNITVIKNLSSVSDYYIVSKNNLKIVNPGRTFRVLSTNCEIVTDKLDDIILYYPDALSKFQSRYMKSVPSSKNTDLDL